MHGSRWDMFAGQVATKEVAVDHEIGQETAIPRKMKFWPKYSSVSTQNWNWGQNASANVLPLFSFKTYLIALKIPKIKLRAGQKPDGEQTNRKGL